MSAPVNWLEQAAQAHNREQGIAPQAQVVPLNIACPICAGTGQPENPLFQNPGARGIQCNKGHKFSDSEQLQALNPKPLKNAPAPRKVVQPNHVDITVNIPISIRDALVSRFGERLQANLAALLRVLTEADAYVVSTDDAKRITEICGQKVRDGGKLYGYLWALTQERNELQQKMNGLIQNQAARNPLAPASASGLTIELDGDARVMAESKAKFNGLSLNEWLNGNVVMAITNGWF